MNSPANNPNPALLIVLGATTVQNTCVLIILSPFLSHMNLLSEIPRVPGGSLQGILGWVAGWGGSGAAGEGLEAGCAEQGGGGGGTTPGISEFSFVVKSSIMASHSSISMSASGPGEDTGAGCS